MYSSKTPVFWTGGKYPLTARFQPLNFTHGLRLNISMKVLVVHRLEEQTKFLKSQFNHWYVQTANTGLDGLLAARLDNYDLILCSLQLPVVTGIEMMRSIRNFSLNQNTPIVVLSEGLVSADHARLLHLLDANLLTLTELEEMDQLAHYLH
ncbi:MAG: PleD family two-component system response regulator [Bacteroidota bacterium]